MANFIPHETIICDDRDPPWINKRIKKIIYEQNILYKDYCKSNDTKIFEKFLKDAYYSNLSTKLVKQKPKNLQVCVKKIFE